MLQNYLLILSKVAHVFAAAFGLIGVLIISVGALLALAHFIHGLFDQEAKNARFARTHIDPVRVEFGRYINLGLEFVIAKDIVETMFTPSWDEIAQLFVLVVIRTIIGIFMMYEMEKIERKQ